jgi:hypothetical protein
MANVRIIAYAGIVQIEQQLVKFHNADSVFLRQEPPLWRQKIALNGATPVTSVVQPNDTATMVVIEVDAGTTVRYEIQPNGPVAGARAADTFSPSISGENPFQWFRGATVSFCDAASV